MATPIQAPLDEAAQIARLLISDESPLWITTANIDCGGRCQQSKRLESFSLDEAITLLAREGWTVMQNGKMLCPCCQGTTPDYWQDQR